MLTQPWTKAHKAHHECVLPADRHYSRTSASDFLRRHGWQMRANHWEHPRFPDVLHSWESALLQAGMWLEQEAGSSELRLKALDEVPGAWLRWWSEWAPHEAVTRMARFELARREGKP